MNTNDLITSLRETSLSKPYSQEDKAELNSKLKIGLNSSQGMPGMSTVYQKNRTTLLDNRFRKEYIEKNEMIKSIYNKTNILNVFNMRKQQFNESSKSNIKNLVKAKEKIQEHYDINNYIIKQVQLPSINSKTASLSKNNKKQSINLNAITINTTKIDIKHKKSVDSSISSGNTIDKDKEIFNHKEFGLVKEVKEKIYDVTNVYKKCSYTSKMTYLVKEFSYFQDQNIIYKDKMEDVSRTIENFTNNENFLFFSLYDGHGGAEVAKFCKDNIPLSLGKSLCSIKNILSNYKSDREKMLYYYIDLFLKSSFASTDENSKTIKHNQSGSTALVALIVYDQGNKYLFIANLGDTAAFLISKTTRKVSTDHLCSNSSEANRIIKAGGSIIFNRVNGELIVTRAFGDHKLKESGVSHEPSIYKKILNDDDKWLIMASDGIWDVISESDLKEANKTIRSSDEFTRYLCKLAVSRGSRDNISCLVIRL